MNCPFENLMSVVNQIVFWASSVNSNKNNFWNLTLYFFTLGIICDDGVEYCCWVVLIFADEDGRVGAILEGANFLLASGVG